MRFDSIIYRLKLAPTINSARQLITHGHFLINKKKVNIPSYQCKLNDEISVRLKSKNLITGLRDSHSSSATVGSGGNSYKSKAVNWEDKKLPAHLILDEQRLTGTIPQTVSLKDPIIEHYYQELKLKPLYIIEFFSRKL